MPAVIIIDTNGEIRYKHFGNPMKDIPANRVLFDALDKLGKNADTD